MKRISWIYIIFYFIFFASFIYAQIKVIYPNINGLGKNTFSYEVLKLALEKSGVDYDLIVSDIKVNDSRVRTLLANNDISIADFGTSREFEDEFLPIYIPIDYGLNGWRIFLIHKDNEDLFVNVKSIKDLRKFSAGQGVGWADVKILENAGLEVLTATHITNLCKMVEGKRFDFFPFGAHSVCWCIEKYGKENPNMIIEQNLLLIYPFARLFFVHKDNQELHDVVKAGLEKSFEDGSFLKLFKQHKNVEIKKANLKNRKQILISNPLMSEEFNKIPKKYFFSLDMLD